MADVDVVVVGAGFAGLYLHHRLNREGWTTQGFEAGDDVGGTWYWNRYPGARCDVESIEYCYSFDEALQQEWEWTERYAGQPEILGYLQHVAARLDLCRHIRFSTRVVSATFDETEARWEVGTDDGAVTTARFVVLATGCLSAANLPDIPGRDSFAGETFHTGRWPHHRVDFTGKRVGVIGTGSSAIQSIPVIASEAAHLTVFQRTPNYSVPARNGPLDPDEVRRVKATYQELRAASRQRAAGFGGFWPQPESGALDVDDEARRRRYEEVWEAGGFRFGSAFNDLGVNKAANDTAAGFVRDKIAEIVRDPQVARLLQPDQVIFCKRLCLDTGYFETFNRPNVRLVDIRATPIDAIIPAGVRLADGSVVELDSLVFATGFDAMTGAVQAIDIRGRDGLRLRDAWAAGPRTWLGLGVAGFPNLFMITGPGSPSVLTNMITAIEQHVEWVSGCLGWMREQGVTTVEASPDAAEAWVRYVNAVAGATLFTTCNSWYLGANIPGKPRVYMPLPGFPPYAEQCAQVAAGGYEGFVVDGQPIPVAAPALQPVAALATAS